MSNSPGQSRETSARKVIIIQALLFTLLFHLVLAFGFVYQNPPAPKNQEEPLYNCIMPLDRSDKSTVQLNNWLKYHDPTLFIKPNSKYGFSAIPQRKSFDIPPQNLPARALPEGIETPARGKAEIQPGDAPASLNGYDPTPPPEGKSMPGPTPVLSKKAEKYPVLQIDSGKELIYPELKDLKIPEGIKSTKITVVATGQGLIPRVILKESCGTRELDQVAVNVALQACAASQIDCQNEVEVIMQWADPESKGGAK